jgi:glyoxylase-like metal-dependent hydrolase (beta-lactamase superfamily II)
MIPLSGGLSYVDVRFQGVPRVIAVAVLHGPGGVALVDPGPSSTLPALYGALEDAGIGVDDVTALLLTHIHLDHAGASGTLVRANPRLRVYVHENGAPHMANPEKLLASAARLWGNAMDRLWGEVRPVPLEAIVALGGGERVEVAGHALEVAYTPGHASHHVSYYSADHAVAFVGDTAGVRPAAGAYILPPTPPPDIDLAAWRDSLSRIRKWHPETLFLTHFGPSAPVEPHMAELVDHLDLVAGLARASLDQGETDDVREAWFVERLRLELRRHMSDQEAKAYEVAGGFDLGWRGLARYWKKQDRR